jgi:hypothetical protein
LSQRRFILGVIDGGIGGRIDDGIRLRRQYRGFHALRFAEVSVGPPNRCEIVFGTENFL